MEIGLIIICIAAVIVCILLLMFFRSEKANREEYKKLYRLLQNSRNLNELFDEHHVVKIGKPFKKVKK